MLVHWYLFPLASEEILLRSSSSLTLSYIAIFSPFFLFVFYFFLSFPRKKNCSQKLYTSMEEGFKQQKKTFRTISTFSKTISPSFFVGPGYFITREGRGLIIAVHLLLSHKMSYQYISRVPTAAHTLLFFILDDVISNNFLSWKRRQAFILLCFFSFHFVHFGMKLFHKQYANKMQGSQRILLSIKSFLLLPQRSAARNLPLFTTQNKLSTSSFSIYVYVYVVTLILKNSSASRFEKSNVQISKTKKYYYILVDNVSFQL